MSFREAMELELASRRIPNDVTIAGPPGQMDCDRECVTYFWDAPYF
jgi:hypothetical protein